MDYRGKGEIEHATRREAEDGSNPSKEVYERAFHDWERRVIAKAEELIAVLKAREFTSTAEKQEAEAEKQETERGQD